ncbi:hypothetical protein HK104_000353 [Borealophlyctis nickersoniae]|nr:hypothetical protein HK104_000353 [Borealophlyctis nickersoniae]
MSLFEVTVTSQTNGNTFKLKNGENILGRSHPDLGLKSFAKLSRQQVKIDVDPNAKKVTAERLGSNTSKLNGRDLPRNQIVELSNGDRITLVINDFPITFQIRDASIPGVNLSDGEVNEDGAPPAGRLEFDDDEGGTSAEEETRIKNGGKERMWPEDFSDESADIVGSGLDDGYSDSENGEDKGGGKGEVEDEKEEPPRKRARKTARQKSPAPSRRRKTSASSDGDSSVGNEGEEEAPSQRRRKGKGKAPLVKPEARPQQRKRTTTSARRVTAYGLFSKKVRPGLKKEYPKQPTAAITKLLKRRFDELLDDERQEYEERAREHNEALEDSDDDDDDNGDGVDNIKQESETWDEVDHRDGQGDASRAATGPLTVHSVGRAQSEGSETGDDDVVGRGDGEGRADAMNEEEEEDIPLQRSHRGAGKPPLSFLGASEDEDERAESQGKGAGSPVRSLASHVKSQFLGTSDGEESGTDEDALRGPAGGEEESRTDEDKLPPPPSVKVEPKPAKKKKYDLLRDIGFDMDSESEDRSPPPSSSRSQSRVARRDSFEDF